MTTPKASIKVHTKSRGIVSRVDVSIPVIERFKDGKYYVTCPLIKAIGYSSISLEDARKQFEDDIKIFFQVHIQRHSLKQTLKGFGWSTGYHNRFVPESALPPSLYKDAHNIQQTVQLAA
jgi:hypothetical protein